MAFVRVPSTGPPGAGAEGTVDDDLRDIGGRERLARRVTAPEDPYYERIRHARGAGPFGVVPISPCADHSWFPASAPPPIGNGSSIPSIA